MPHAEDQAGQSAPPDVRPASPMRSLERALDVVAVLQKNRGPLRLTEVAREARLHLATAQRILNVLIRYGYVQQNGPGYTLGISSLLNAHTFLLTDQLSLIATPVLQELSIETTLTASLSVRVGWSQVILVRIEGAQPLRYQLPVGEQLPLHLGGARVLAAALSLDERAAMIESLDAIRLATGEVLTSQSFSASLDAIREAGYAAGVSQRERGAASAAVPVFDREGEVCAALQLSGLAEDFTSDRTDRYVEELKRASAAITRRMP